MRKTVPVVVAGGALILLASQFLTFNVGLRDPSTPLEKQVADKVEDASQVIKDTGEKVVNSLTGETAPPTQVPPENDYVDLPLADVLIDGDNYLLLTSPTVAGEAATSPANRKQVAMYEVIRLARELPGDSTGIQVRVWRTANATAQAERELLAALKAANITEDKIDYRNRLVE